MVWVFYSLINDKNEVAKYIDEIEDKISTVDKLGMATIYNIYQR